MKLLEGYAEGFAAFAIVADGEALVSCAVNWTRRGGRRAQQFRGQGLDLAVPFDLCLQVRLEPSISAEIASAAWLANAERCIAWALIEGA